MTLTKFAVTTAVLLLGTAAMLASSAEVPTKLLVRMKGVKRDASHIAKYYLPAHHHHQHHTQTHQFGLHSGASAGGASYGGHQLQGAQHLQVLDVKLPQSHGHYIPHYAVPSKSYESNAHHFQGHAPQFQHTGQQYVLSASHGGKFEELAGVLGGQGGQGASGASGASSGHISFGGHPTIAAPVSSIAPPSYTYLPAAASGHQGQAQASAGTATLSAQGGYAVASAEAGKTGPISFGDAAQGGQQQVQQQTSFGGHQFGFISAAGGHAQAAQAAPQIAFIPQTQALSTSIGAAHEHRQATPVYAVGMKGLGHYATGNTFRGHVGAPSASFGHGLSLGGSSGGHQGQSYSSFTLGHGGSGQSYGGGHGGYILDTSALQGLGLSGKLIIMSKPTALTYPGQSYGHQAPKFQLASGYSGASLGGASLGHSLGEGSLGGSLGGASLGGSLGGGHGGYKSAAPFKPSVFLGATQESVSEYQHGGAGQEAVSYSTVSSGAAAGGDYSAGAQQEYKFVAPTAAAYGGHEQH